MNLTVRIIRFLASMVFRLLLVLIATAIHMLMPVVLAVLRSLRGLTVMSMTAMVHGPAQYTNRLASQWTRRLIELGASREYIDEIYGLCRFTAMSMICAGWVVSVLFSVAILRVVFGIWF